MIPLFSPLRNNEAHLAEIEARVARVIRSGEYILGKEVEDFEKSLAKRLGYQHAIGCSNGTDALVLALRALNLPEGSEVVTPAFSFIASASCVVWAGLKPVFADVALETACVTPETVEKALTPNTRAVIAVDLFGRQAPIAELRRFCDQRGLYLIEDGAQSIGVPPRGAHFYTTSFYPTKNLGGIGDGGAVLSDDAELATRVREMTRHGGLMRDHYVRVGTTGRLDALQAAVLNVKLPHLDAGNALRRSLAAWYGRDLAPLEAKGKIRLPREPKDPSTHVWALYTVRVPADIRAQTLEALRAKGIAAGPYYPKALPDQPALKAFAGRGDYAVSRQLASEVVSLPFFPELTGKELDEVVKGVTSWLTSGSTSSFTSR